MAKLELTYENKNYILEFNRQSVKTMEAQGFNIEELTKKPMTMIPLLFYGAFFKNHKGVKRSLVEEIYDNLQDKNGLLSTLVELYAETLSGLMESSENSEGNAIWKMDR